MSDTNRVTAWESRVTVARADGYVCDDCEEPIARSCVLVELRVDDEPGLTFAYHPRCYDQG